MKIEIHPDLRDIVRLGVLRLTEMALPQDDGASLWKLIDERCQGLHEEHQGRSSGQVEGVSEARQLYHETDASISKRETDQEHRRLQRAGLQQPAGRPDKHDRRALTELKKRDPAEHS